LVGGLVSIAIITNHRREHDEVARRLDLSDDTVIDLTPGAGPVDHRSFAEAFAPERQHHPPSQPKFPRCLERDQVAATGGRADHSGNILGQEQVSQALAHERQVRQWEARRAGVLRVDASSGERDHGCH
jgi:hypothetical protein